jgi:hypothetical protein
LQLKTLEKFISKLKRLNTECTIFQAKLCRIGMAVDWIQNQWKGTSSYAINVDSKAAILAIANKHSTHLLAQILEENNQTMDDHQYHLPLD